MSPGKAGKPLSVAFRAFPYAVVALGLIDLCLAAYRLALSGCPNQWMIIAALAAFAGSITVRIPGVRSKVSLSESLIFTNLILFGTAAGTLTAAVDGVMGSLRARTVSRRIHYLLFNTSTMVLSASLAGKAFFQFLGQGPLARQPVEHFAEVVPALFVLALVSYGVNSALVAAIVAHETGENIVQVWRTNFLWAAVSYFGGASVAGVLALNADLASPAWVGYTVPFLLVTYFMYRAHQDKVQQNMHNQELDRLYLSTVEALAMAIDAKDHATQGHANRVLVLARGLARAVGMRDPKELRAVEAAALLHDIGNLAVPDYILNKPGKLTPSEFDKVKIHPVVGARILGTIPFPYPVAEYVRHHHERWDGSGYPDRLSGDLTPLGSRILAVVDAYEALTVDRPYQRACSREKAMDIIRSLASTRFDPYVVERFEGVLDALLAELRARETSQQTTVTSTDATPETSPAKPRDFQPFHDISRTQREAAALFEFARNLVTTLNLKETLTLVTAEVAKLVPFTTCVVYLGDDESGLLTVAHVSGENRPAFADCVVKLGERLSGWVAAHKKPLVNADPAPEIAPFRDCIEVPLRTALVFPLLLDRQCLGAIALYAGAHQQFLEDHVRIMEIVSGQAATAIQNARQFEETREDACTDSLTGLPNARFLNPHIDQELKRAERYGQPVGVLLMDLDGFKNVNDRHGHHAGDLVIIEVARALKQEMRETDVVVRWRGDEFVALLPQTGCSDALILAERIRKAIDDLRIDIGDGVAVRIGISVGVSCFPEEGSTAEELIDKADAAMYRDKRARRESGSSDAVAGRPA